MRPGDAAEEGEGPDVALEECLGALAREGAAEQRVGIRQGHDEDGHLGGPAVEGDLGLAEVHLGQAGSRGSRQSGAGNEDNRALRRDHSRRLPLVAEPSGVSPGFAQEPCEWGQS